MCLLCPERSSGQLGVWVRGLRTLRVADTRMSACPVPVSAAEVRGAWLCVRLECPPAALPPQPRVQGRISSGTETQNRGGGPPRGQEVATEGSPTERNRRGPPSARPLRLSLGPVLRTAGCPPGPRHLWPRKGSAAATIRKSALSPDPREGPLVWVGQEGAPCLGPGGEPSRPGSRARSRAPHQRGPSSP